MKKEILAGPKKTGSELKALLLQIKFSTKKSFKEMAIECGYKAENHFSHVLKDEKNGRAVPETVLHAIKTRYAAVLLDEVIVEMREDEQIKNLLQSVGALRTEVQILIQEVAGLKAHAYRSDFDNEHAAMKLRMKEGVESILRTMKF